MASKSSCSCLVSHELSDLEVRGALLSIIESRFVSFTIVRLENLGSVRFSAGGSSNNGLLLNGCDVWKSLTSLTKCLNRPKGLERFLGDSFYFLAVIASNCSEMLGHSMTNVSQFASEI